MKKGYLSLLFLLPVIISGAQVKGVIQLKIQPEFEQQLEQTLQARQANVTAVPLQVGIQRFDALNTRFGTTSLRRVFPDAGEYEALHRKAGLHLWYELYFDGNANVEEAVAAYGHIGEIAQAGKVYPIKRIINVPPDSTMVTPEAHASPAPAATTVNDPLFTKQWHYHNTGQNGATKGIDINLPEAWDYTMGDSEIIVAIVDGGIDFNHPDLKNAMWSGIGKNFVTSGSSVTPDDHGTHVAGVTGAITNNGAGVSGIAGGNGSGNGIRLMSCQIFEGDKTTSKTNQAIIYAADNGAVICQNSWGYDEAGMYNATDSVAIKYFIDHAGKLPDGSARPGTKMNGGVVIFAAGNETSNGRWYPGCFDFVTSVSAIGYNGKRAYYSNYGPWVDIAAPGGDSNHGMRGIILSAIPTNSSYAYKEGAGYGWMQGTSMACPHVSGVAALILSRYGNTAYTPSMLRERLIDSTSSLASYDPTFASLMGKGLLNAERALSGSIVHASSVAMDNCMAEVSVGATWTLSATVLPEISINKDVTFSSGDPSVIALSEINGQTMATGKKPGQTSITVTTKDGDIEDVCLVNVVIPVEGVTLEPYMARLQAGDTIRFRATIEPGNAGNKNITWHSDNPGVAQLGNNGLVTIISGGSPNNPKKATIKVTTENGSYTSKAEIYAYNEVYAPEGFSPNGDGINETFVLASNPHENYMLTVFDRSGQTHFRSDDYKNEWDGTANTGPYSGNKLPAGTYLYILSAKKSGQVKKDFVVIKY
ncbi:MAG: S8 family serine peptidase [Prevotellaceae bacterium]|jgi:gliding motility-associated-like protein|nr:S8 family serine peptidase [Prevotellaceae bacterium]